MSKFYICLNINICLTFHELLTLKFDVGQT